MPLHEETRMKIVEQYAGAHHNGMVKFGPILQRLESNNGLWSLKTQHIDFDKISMKSNRSFMVSAAKAGGRGSLR